MGERWDAGDIPDQGGRLAVVTGANSGLGLVTARELARHGARVVLACRNRERGEAALKEVTEAASGPAPELEELDLADLSSVRSFADRLAAGGEELDLLINNAGVMAPPRRRTADGFELQFGTNHLGHFALTKLLLPLMEGREDARVVTLSSTAHRMGRIAFDNLNGDRRYFRWNAYGQSKLANLLFALELDRRLRASGSTVKSLAAHPGYAATNLQSAAAPLVDRLLMRLGNLVIAQNDEMCAAGALRGHGPRARGRCLHRARRAGGAARIPEARPAEQGRARRGHRSPAVGRERGAHRRSVRLRSSRTATGRVVRS
jgi:NAD(P)-dependent dehydrogenase (short-subunit alcohol dehydrogenase family)